jgi:hypothetical protein
MGLILNNINVSMMESKGWLSADALISFLVIIILLTSFINIISIRIDTVNSIELASESRVLGENMAQQIETTHTLIVRVTIQFAERPEPYFMSITLCILILRVFIYL